MEYRGALIFRKAAVRGGGFCVFGRERLLHAKQ